MQRTISAMVGKGSVNHNSRKFRAENVDGTRTHLNIDYCNENIKTVYHELFERLTNFRLLVSWKAYKDLNLEDRLWYVQKMHVKL